MSTHTQAFTAKTFIIPAVVYQKPSSAPPSAPSSPSGASPERSGPRPSPSPAPPSGSSSAWRPPRLAFSHTGRTGWRLGWSGQKRVKVKYARGHERGGGGQKHLTVVLRNVPRHVHKPQGGAAHHLLPFFHTSDNK